MSPAADALAARVRETGLLPAGQPVVVLLSGGRDSVALLDLAVLACGPDVVSALHVNYGLRAESGEDEAACAALCRRLDVALQTEHVAAPAGAGNLQGWARDVRYGAGVRIAAARRGRLAAGHTTTDQAETILYRLAASPGRRALLGMPEQRGLLIRPLLAAGISREETGAWCAARGLSWVDDASNDSDVFMRGRVRHSALPALREEAAVLDLVIDTALAGRDRIEVAHLAALPPAVARLVVRRLAEDAAGGLCPRAAARLPDLLALGRARSAAMLDVGDGARAVVEGGALRFERTPRRERPPSPANP